MPPKLTPTSCTCKNLAPASVHYKDCPLIQVPTKTNEEMIWEFKLKYPNIELRVSANESYITGENAYSVIETLLTEKDQELQKARHDWLREEIVKLEGIQTHFVPADSEWFGKEDYSEGEYKLVPAKDPSKVMYCLTCERFLHEEGCNCGTVALQTIIDRYQSELDQPNK